MEKTNNSLDWIKCCFELKIENVVRKLELAEFDVPVKSRKFGTGNLQWKIGLAKEKLNADISAKNESAANNFAVGVYLFLVSNVADGVEAKYKLDYVDNERFQPSSQPLYKSFITCSPQLFKFNEPGWGNNLWTKSALESKSYLDSTGALSLRATIRIKNSHQIAYDLAAHVHSLRLAAHVVKDKPASDTRLPLIQIRACQTVGSNEYDDDEEDDAVKDDNKSDIKKNESDENADDDDDQAMVDVEESMDTWNTASVNEMAEMSFEPVVAWKSMLVHASPVFKTMLKENTDLVESESGIVTIKDFPYEAVRLFVNYIEQGPTAIAGNAVTMHLPTLVRMAHMYLVKDLYNLGVARMLETIELGNVAEYYATACLLRIVDVKDACIKAIKQNWKAWEAGSSGFWEWNFAYYYGMTVACEAFADYVKLG